MSAEITTWWVPTSEVILLCFLQRLCVQSSRCRKEVHAVFLSSFCLHTHYFRTTHTTHPHHTPPNTTAPPDPAQSPPHKHRVITHNTSDGKQISVRTSEPHFPFQLGPEPRCRGRGRDQGRLLLFRARLPTPAPGQASQPRVPTSSALHASLHLK